MVSKHEFFMPLLICPRINIRKRLFLHIPASFMEFFDAYNFTSHGTQERSIRQLKRKKEKRRKQKREGGICPIARRADILVKE